jgi:hypothetical protein
MTGLGLAMIVPVSEGVSVERVTIAIFCLAFCLPAVLVFTAASAWRAKLRRPRLFVVMALALLYLLAGYLATRPIQTHAVMFKLDASQELQQDPFDPWLRLALLTLAGLATASGVVLLFLRRLMSR